MFEKLLFCVSLSGCIKVHVFKILRVQFACCILGFTLSFQHCIYSVYVLVSIEMSALLIHLCYHYFDVFRNSRVV